MFVLANTSSQKFIPYEPKNNTSYVTVKNKQRFKNANNSSNFMNMSLGHNITYKNKEEVNNYVTSLHNKSISKSPQTARLGGRPNVSADNPKLTYNNITTMSYKNEVEDTQRNNKTKNMLEELGEKVSLAIKQDLTNTKINKSLENNIEGVLGLLSQKHSPLFALLKIYSPADSFNEIKKMVYEYHTGNNKIIWKGSNYSPNYRQITMNLSKQTGLLKTAFGKVLMKQFVRSLTQVKDNDVDNKITSVNIFDNIFYILGLELKKLKELEFVPIIPITNILGNGGYLSSVSDGVINEIIIKNVTKYDIEFVKKNYIVEDFYNDTDSDSEDNISSLSDSSLSEYNDDTNINITKKTILHKKPSTYNNISSLSDSSISESEDSNKSPLVKLKRKNNTQINRYRK